MKTLIVSSILLLFVLALAAAPVPRSFRTSSQAPVVKTADTCYYSEDADGNISMTCVADDPFDPCGDGSCQ